MLMNEEQRSIILQAEIMALLHDIGKFSPEFVQGRAPLPGGKTEKNLITIHTRLFRRQDGPCDPGLLERLANIPAPDLHDGNLQLKAIGDLQEWHHGNNVGELRKYLGGGKGALPRLLFLMLYADTIDSATSKGGAVFKPGKGVKRNARLDLARSKQKGRMMMATPFGREEPLAEVGERSRAFQKELAALFDGYDPGAPADTLAKTRDRLVRLLEQHLDTALAETRLPNNDVTLWQHSRATAALFKAMLARHLVEKDVPYHDGNENPAHHQEKLSLLALTWDEAGLIGRAFRPAEILGLRRRLDLGVDAISAWMETEACLGNEIYRDRNSIVFLVPGLQGDAHNRLVGMVKDKADAELNHPKRGLAGELAWQCRMLDLEAGHQLTRMPELLAGGGETVATGPTRPAWTREWQDGNGKGKRQGICVRCGLRPVSTAPDMTSSGSEGDDRGNRCGFCSLISEEGGRYRKGLTNGNDVPDRERKRYLRLIGLPPGETANLDYDITRLIPRGTGDDPGNRLTLVQGVFDLRPMLSGEAFAAMLTARPQDYCNDAGANDRSPDMDDWEKMLAAVRTAIKGDPEKEENLHTLQQLLRDIRFGTAGDGRVPGTSKGDKARAYLDIMVARSPFPAMLADDAARVVNYALRKHPSPSRLARVWQSTLDICRFPMQWCERNRIHYATVGVDPGRFQILIDARHAWGLLTAVRDRYEERCGRVRHHLPLHLSATVFHHKSPLYIAVDAARRFAELGLQRSEKPQPREIVAREDRDGEVLLRCRTPRGREITVACPTRLHEGREDLFYPWFWKEGEDRRPVHIDELGAGDRIAVYSGSFDYEYLDASTRRYDIRNPDGRGRPHPVRRRNGPRPYPLEIIGQWQELTGLFAGKEDSHQVKHLQELISRLHMQWPAPEDAEALAGVAEDALRSVFHDTWERHGAVLRAMARDVSILDLIEWQSFIGISNQDTRREQ